jgi:hypothetical protein
VVHHLRLDTDKHRDSDERLSLSRATYIKYGCI